MVVVRRSRRLVSGPHTILIEMMKLIAGGEAVKPTSPVSRGGRRRSIGPQIQQWHVMIQSPNEIRRIRDRRRRGRGASRRRGEIRGIRHLTKPHPRILVQISQEREWTVRIDRYALYRPQAVG